MSAKPDAFPNIMNVCPAPDIVAEKSVASGAPIIISLRPSLLKSPAEDTLKPNVLLSGPYIYRYIFL